MIPTRPIAKGGATFEVSGRDEYRAFWDWYETDAWEPETVAIFDRFLRADTRYVDLGAWIGPTVFLAARVVSRIVCVEPDPLAFAALAENLELNPGVARKTDAIRAAVGADDGIVTLTSAGAGGDSNSSAVRPGDDGAHWEVEQLTFATLLSRANLPAADFVKIDVEGAEYELLSRMPLGSTLYVALHPNLFVDKRSLLARARSSIRALRANRRMLHALRAYRHHYVFDANTGQFRDIRTRNLLRAVLPLPLRASFLIGSCVFTNETI
jgi:FkbM family methyltransferase